jgi:hypothetical protein
MTTVSFNTFELVDRLKAAGFAQEQAEAVVRIISDAQNELVTKCDLKDAFREFDATVIAPLKTDLAVLKWMMGGLIAGNMAVIIKLFFNH